MPDRVVVFAIGNRSRGDDAIGPLLLDRLADWLAGEGGADRFELIEDYQLQIEYALDLTGKRLALFIDAGTGTAAPFDFYPIRAAHPPVARSTHALPPEGVLDVYRQFNAAEPPPSFILCVRGESFELGEGLSPAGSAHVEAAWALLTQLCAQPDPEAWSGTARR